MLTVGMYVADRYEIIGKVGAGGMSDVYKAKDHILGRFVAIKVLKAEFSEDRTFVTKFRSEAQSAAGLEHPNIVNIYDVGSEDGMYFIVMEYVEGITLKTYVEKKGQLSFKEAASISIQVARGIEAAHNKGIVHRDIKPQNIIISTEGKVKVTDFGIARAASSNTISADVMGSVHYASPEQARNGFVDCKSDIYSLGIVMFEMITGRVPFDGDTTVAVAIQHLQEEMPAPSLYAPNIPISFEKIIIKCTQKNADRRYQTVDALISDLRRAITNPDEDFVVITPIVDNGKTKIISDDELKQIREKNMASNTLDEIVDTDADDYDEDDEDDEFILNPKMDKAVTIMGAIAAVVIFIVIIYFFGAIFGLWRFGGSKDKTTQQTETQTETQQSEASTEEMVTMISVIGSMQADAENAIKNLGLNVSVVTEESTENAGKVIKQSIDPNTQVAKGTMVTITVAGEKEEEVIAVPNVAGYTESNAISTLESAGFVVKQTYENSDDVAAGVVISQDVTGTATKGTVINLVISQGAQAIKVTDVVGKTEAKAKKELSDLGLDVKVESEYSDTVEEGKVISQSISAGTTVQKGKQIVIVVSLGAKQVTYYYDNTLTLPGAASIEYYLYDANGVLITSGTVNKDTADISASGITTATGRLVYTAYDAEGNIVSSQDNNSVTFKQQ